MLNQIKKEFNKLFNPISKDKTEMKKDQSQPEQAASEVVAKLDAALATIAAKDETLKELSGKFTELSSKYDEMKKSFDAMLAEKAAMIAEAAQKRLSARKEKVEMAVGTEKASALLAATESLDDAQFEAIVEAMKTTLKTEAEKNPMFQEVGMAGEADHVETLEAAGVTKEAEMLKEKYAKK
jgi:hypothetical protein